MTTPMRPSTAAGRLLTQVHATGTTTRAAATAHAALARSAAGAAAAELEALGLIRLRDAVAVPGGRGRPSPILEPVPASAVAITAEVRPDGIDLAAIGLGRTVLDRRHVPLQPDQLAPDILLPLLGQGIDKLAATAGDACVGVGVALPGMVDPATGHSQAILHLSWRDVPVAALLGPHLPAGVPLALAHDAALAAVAEHRCGTGSKDGWLLVLTAEPVGLGGAMVTPATDPLTGGHPLQAGHLMVDPNGPRCTCGSRGCLELYVDGRAMARALDLPAETGMAELSRAVSDAAADPAAVQALEPVLSRLETGLVSLVNTLGPDRVVLSGLLADLGRATHERLTRALHTSVVARVRPVTLVASELPDAVLIGAAEAAFQPLLSDPLQLLQQLGRH